MKNKFFLLCMFATLTCTTSSNVFAFARKSNVENNSIGNYLSSEIAVKKNEGLTPRELKLKGEYSTPNGIHFNVNALAKGIDLVKNDIIHPNVNEVKAGSYIFDQEWLLSKYDEAAENCLIQNGTVSHIYTSGSSMTEMIESTQKKFSNTATIKASMSSYAAGLKNTIHTNSTSSKYACTSFMYVSDRITYDSFKIDMPEIESNKSIYIQHLSEGFTNYIDSILNGELTWFDLFDVFGTHVLGSASFGGYCYLNYEAKTQKAVLTQEDMLDFAQEVNLKGSYKGIDFDAREELEINIAEKHEISTSDVSVMIDQTFVGGPAAYCIPAADPDDICWRTTEWLKHVDENVVITRYLRAAPIWDYIPFSVPNRTVVMSQAKQAYDHYEELNSFGPEKFNNATFSKTVQLIKQNEGEKTHVGAFDAFDKINVTKTIDVEDNKSKLPCKELLLDPKFAYDKVQIKIDFDYRDTFLPSKLHFSCWYGLNTAQPQSNDILVDEVFEPIDTNRRSYTTVFPSSLNSQNGLFGTRPGLCLCFENKSYGPVNAIGGDTEISNLKVTFTFSSSQSMQ